MRRLTPRQIRKMRRAGQAAAATLHTALQFAQPGVTGRALHQLVLEHTRAQGGRCAQLGVRVPGAPPFPGTVCISPNDVVCHGVPTDDPLPEGCLLSLDVTTELDGWHGDTCATLVLGRGTPEALHLLQTARRARDLAMEAVRPGVHLHALGALIEDFVRSEGCYVVREFGGHGIGRSMHEAPHVHHHRVRSPGPRLQAGHCFTLEPILTLTPSPLITERDGWTIRTADGGLAAQFEHTVLVTPTGAEVLTRR